MLLTVFFLKRPQPPFTFFASFFPNFFSRPQPLPCAFLSFLIRPHPLRAFFLVAFLIFFLPLPQPEAFFLVFLMAFAIFFLREPQPVLPQPFFFLMLLTVFFLKRPQPPFTFFASFFPNFFSRPQPLPCAFLSFLIRRHPLRAFFLVAFLIFFATLGIF